MKQIVRWIRRVYPPAWAVLVVLFLVGGCEALFWWVRFVFSVSTDSVSELLRIRDATILVSAGGYALFRVGAFHPIFRPKYRDWLGLVPWTADKPLPLGPVTLVVQDLVMILLMRAFLHDYQMLETSLPLVFLFTYVAVATVAIFASGERSIGYVLLFGLGAAVRCQWWTPWAALIVLAAFYGVVVYGLQRSLLAFPWTKQTAALRTHFADARQVRNSQIAVGQMGWPYYLLHADDPASDVPRRERVIIGLAAGWIFYSLAAGLSYSESDNVKGIAFAICGLAFACAVGRLGVYYCNHWPPISFWGRLRTGRWIIPAYDVGLLAPACVAIGGCGGWIALGIVARRQAVLVAPLGGVLVASLLIVTFVAGPSYRKWRLATPCRISPVKIGPANLFEKL